MEEYKINTVSYSAYSTFKTCPHKWKLSYIDKLQKYDATLHTVFGTCIHETIQNYVEVLYNIGFQEADEINLYEDFKERMLTNLKKEENSKIVYQKEDLFGFILDAKEILDWLSVTNNRMKLFPNNKYQVIGTEFHMQYPLKDNLLYNGYYDLILKEKTSDKYRILDFKTSTNGWSKYEKSQDTKLNQLLLYKKFYSDKFSVPDNNISVEFIILKRKIPKTFLSKRVEIYKPVQGKVSLNNAYKDFINFVNECYTENGDLNKTKIFKKTPHSQNKKYANCSFCPYFDMGKCDREEDK